MSAYAILPAGGTGSRYHPNRSKLLETIHSQCIIEYSIKVLYSISTIQRMVIPCHPATKKDIQAILAPYESKVVFTNGGKTRSESVKNAMMAIPNTCQHVLIHDAARPNISPSCIQRVLDGLSDAKVIIPGIPLTDTIKQIHDQKVVKTLDRSSLYAVQTPQGFCYQTLRSAYNHPELDIAPFTDEASILEAMGIYAHMVEGDPNNIKVTHPVDRQILSALLSAS